MRKYYEIRQFYPFLIRARRIGPFTPKPSKVSDMAMKSPIKFSVFKRKKIYFHLKIFKLGLDKLFEM